MPSGVLRNLAQPGGCYGGGRHWGVGDDDEDEEDEEEGHRAPRGSSSMVASVARDRIQASFGKPSNLAGAKSHRMPTML